jgi:sec-independent protein translocase protein TatA
MFGEIGPEKILLILVVVLLFFGAKRIPEIGSSLGRGIREFKRSVNDLHNDVHADLGPAPRDYPAATTPAADSGSAAGQDEVRSEPKRLMM